MKKLLRRRSQQVIWPAVAAVVMAGAAGTARATEWQVTVGAESSAREIQALAFLPNELWIQAGDSIRFTFPTHERHTLSLLTAGQTRPAGFGSTFGVLVGCPGITPSGSVFSGSTCVTSDLLRVDDEAPAPSVQSYSVTFPSAGNFKFVCLLHADMTGTVHVVSLSATLPYNQANYYQRASSQQASLLASGFSTEMGEALPGQAQSGQVIAGTGSIISTGAGAQTVSLNVFSPGAIFVNVGDTVEWTNLDPSINHTVVFGTEPADPRTISTSVQTASDGARQAVIASPTDSVSSGYLTPTPQDRANLAQAAPGVTRFRVTFTSPGTFNYICALHDELGMKGIVVVGGVPAPGGAPLLNASPNPIPVTGGAAYGATTINWNAPNASSIEIHIGSANGPLFVSGGSQGSAPTGAWVADGTSFYLVDVTNGRNTLATLVVHLLKS
jgi:plastocyanin